ncbi:hypothetical protein [Bradyrhizobium sp. URHC0002]
MLETLQARQARLDVILFHRRRDTECLARCDECGDGRSPLRDHDFLARIGRFSDLGIGTNAKGRQLIMRPLCTGNHLILAGKMPLAHANQRLLKRPVAEFAEICDRSLLGLGRGIGGIKRQIGRAALASPLAGTFQQHVRGFVDRCGVRSRCTLQSRIPQDVPTDPNAEEGQQRDRCNEKIANVPHCRDLRGRIDTGHFRFPQRALGAALIQNWADRSDGLK